MSEWQACRCSGGGQGVGCRSAHSDGVSLRLESPRQSLQNRHSGLVDRSRHCCEHKENRCNGSTKRTPATSSWDDRKSTTIDRLAPLHWADFEDLFGKQCACYGCWCTHFPLTPRDARSSDKERNKTHQGAI